MSSLTWFDVILNPEACFSKPSLISVRTSLYTSLNPSVSSLSLALLAVLPNGRPVERARCPTLFRLDFVFCSYFPSGNQQATNLFLYPLIHSIMLFDTYEVLHMHLALFSPLDLRMTKQVLVGTFRHGNVVVIFCICCLFLVMNILNL